MSKCELSELMPNGTFSFSTLFLPIKSKGIKWDGNANKSQNMGLFSFDTLKYTAHTIGIPKDSSGFSF